MIFQNISRWNLSCYKNSFKRKSFVLSHLIDICRRKRFQNWFNGENCWPFDFGANSRSLIFQYIIIFVTFHRYKSKIIFNHFHGSESQENRYFWLRLFSIISVETFQFVPIFLILPRLNENLKNMFDNFWSRVKSFWTLKIIDFASKIAILFRKWIF